MAEIVNLRRARKSKARGEREKVAEANRVQHGTPKRVRDAAKADRDKGARTLEAHRLKHDDES
jgi:hypothetical protein